MNKNYKKSRKYSVKEDSRTLCRKALRVIEEIAAKYPSGISDVKAINEEARAWLQQKIQQLRESVKDVYFPDGKPYLHWHWWNKLRLTRNKTAHQMEDLSDKAFSNVCSKLFLNIDTIKQDLNSYIDNYEQPSKKIQNYEGNANSDRLGTKSQREQTVDAIKDAIQPVGPKDVKIPFLQNTFAQAVQHTLSEILNTQEMKDYMQRHTGLAENVLTDILEWLQKTDSALEKENPFWDEASFVAQQNKQSAEEIAADLSAEKSKIQHHYNLLPTINDSTRGTIQESTLDFDFYRKAFAAQRSPKDTTQWESPEKLETLRRNFIADMEKNLIERKTKWEQERIDAMRKQFSEELYKKIQNFMRLEKLLTPFTKNFGRLWDLAQHPFEASGFEILATFANLLEQDKSLQELADLLGRQSRTQAIFEKELRDKIVITTEWHPQPAYRGEINGLRYSNDIAAALPTELALLKNAAAKKLFQLKFAQKQLLSFEYQDMQAATKKTVEQEEANIEKKEPKGPIIICVDTSVSMRGTPENIAKTVTFALTKIAVEQERKCFVISFSTGIETLELTGANEGNYLQKLVNFLRMSFNGGTDAEPALRKALNMLAGSDTATGYKNADVLMISDFVMGNLAADLVSAIEQEKEKNTGFYSLVIGASGNKNTIACFNHNWLYDTNDTRASRHLVEQLHELKTRK